MNAFTIYEKHPTADAYRVGGFYSPYALASTDKDLSEAELAAEFWLLSSRRARMLGYKDGLGSETAKQAHIGLERMDTVLRFAQLPHASESDYQ